MTFQDRIFPELSRIFNVRGNPAFRITPENFSPRSFQVRTTGQVKWHYPKNIFDCVLPTVFKGSIRNRQHFHQLIRASVPTKRMYRNLISETWDQANFVTSPLLAIGKCSNPLIRNVRVGVCYVFSSRFSYIKPLSMTWMQFWPLLRVIRVHCQFLPLTFNIIEREHWGWSQFVSLA